jgi:flavin reductase (DIM6/NTAB) family NADH-FMN oxidoreductase RutF
MKFGFKILAMAMVMAVSCGHRGDNPEDAKAKADSLLTGTGIAETVVPSDTIGPGWKKIDPSELTMAPVKAFASDWMALSVGKPGKSNSMTISWGEIGELWGKPVVTVFVSQSRYTHSLLDDNKYFCLSQLPDLPKYRKALETIGSVSYRDNPSKTEDAGLSFMRTPLGNPAIAQAWRVIECRIIYSDDFDLEKMPAEVRKVYSEDLKVHTFYVAEIKGIYERAE